jgi:hypothetical protein
MAQSVYNIAEAVHNWGTEYAIQAGLHKYFPVMSPESHIFFVDGDNGSDSADNNGQTADTPLLTITAALGKCTTKKNDYIFLLNYYRASGETWPISITKENVHIIGMASAGCPRVWVDPPSTTAAFELAQGSAHCEIANIQIGAGATSACIDLTCNGAWGHWIHHNYFAMKQSMDAKYGILIGETGYGENIHGLIEHNIFGAGITESGICISANGGNSVRGMIIRNNHFTVNSGDHGVDVLNSGADFQEGGIFNNTFEVDGDAADGEAVYFVSGAKGNVHGNSAWTDDGVIPENNPFFDAGTTNMSWGANIRGGGVATGPYLATPTNI